MREMLEEFDEHRLRYKSRREYQKLDTTIIPGRDSPYSYQL
jgi:hypothetical protein